MWIDNQKQTSYEYLPCFYNCIDRLLLLRAELAMLCINASCHLRQQKTSVSHNSMLQPRMDTQLLFSSIERCIFLTGEGDRVGGFVIKEDHQMLLWTLFLFLFLTSNLNRVEMNYIFYDACKTYIDKIWSRTELPVHQRLSAKHGIDHHFSQQWSRPFQWWVRKRWVLQ